MPLDLKIVIPKPNTKEFDRGFNKVFKTLDKVEKQLKRIDKLMGRVGRVGSAGSRGRSGGGSGSSRRRSRGGGIGRALGGAGRGLGSIIGQGGGRALGNLGRLTSAAASGLGKLASSGASAVAALGPLIPIAIAAGVALAALAVVTIGLGIALVKGIPLASQFESQLNEIGRVADISGKDLKAFGTSIVALSLNLPIATDKLFQLASAGANAGLQASQLDKFVRSMAKLATILPNLTEEQVRGLIRIADLTGFPVERIDELNGSIVRLQQSSKATLPQLIQLGQRVAQDAGIFGIATRDVNALAATIADLGLQPERASTAVGRLVGELKDLETASDATLQSIVDTFRNPISVQTFREIAASGGPIETLKFLGKETANAREALEALGITGKQNVIDRAVLQNIEKFIELQEAAKLSSDIIDDQAAQKVKEFGKQLELAQNNLNNIFRVIAQAVLPTLTKMLKAFNELTEGIRSANDVFKLFGKIALRAAGGGSIVDAINKAEKAARDVNFDVIAEKFAGAIAKLEVEGDKLARSSGGLLDPRTIAKRVNEIDAQLIKLKTSFRTELTEAGIPLERINRILDGIETTGARINIGKSLKDATNASNILEQKLQGIRSTLADLRGDTGDLDFKLSIADKTSFEQDIETSIRNANKAFSSLLGTSILTPRQIEGLQKDIQKTLGGQGINLDLGKGLDESIASIKALQKELPETFAGPLADALTQLQTLQGSERTLEELRRKRNLELRLILKDQLKAFDKEAANIKSRKAPAVAAIQDAGIAVQQFNQRLLDELVQNEELEELQRIRQIAEDRLRLEENNRIRPITRPSGR